MKKIIALTIAFVMLLSACAAPSPRPESGIWYCKDMGVFLDLENGEGVYINNNGGYAPLRFDIDYGTGFFIHFYENASAEESYETMFSDFVYADGVLVLTKREEKIEYEFIEVDRKHYPGG